MSRLFSILSATAVIGSGLNADCIKQDTDYKYQTFRNIGGITTAEECAELCRQAKDDGCLFATLKARDSDCRLKKAGYSGSRSGYISMSMNCLYPEEFPSDAPTTSPVDTSFRLESQYHCGDHEYCGYTADVDQNDRIKLTLDDGVHWKLEQRGDYFSFKVDSCPKNDEQCGKYICADGSKLFVCEDGDESIVEFEKVDNGSTSGFRDRATKKWLRLDEPYLKLSSSGIAPYRLIFDNEQPAIACPDGTTINGVALQLVHVYDNSASYRHNKDEWASQYNRLVNQLGERFAKVEVGLTTYIDKPRPGQAVDVDYEGTRFCYGYRLDSNLSSNNYIDFHDTLLNLKSPTGGYDRPENSLDALGWSVRDSNVEWNTESFDEDNNLVVRVLVVSTDNFFKTSHPEISGILPACDLSKEQNPEETDMCSEEQVIQLVKGHNARVFAMLSGDDDAFDAWTGLSDRFNAAGVPMSVHKQNLNGSGMVDNVITGINDSLCLIKPKPIEIDNDLVVATRPPTTTTTRPTVPSTPEQPMCPVDDSCLTQGPHERESNKTVENVLSLEECVGLCCEMGDGCLSVAFVEETHVCRLAVKTVVEESVDVDMGCLRSKI